MRGASLLRNTNLLSVQYNAQVGTFLLKSELAKVLQISSVFFISSFIFSYNTIDYRINHWIGAKKPRVYQETGLKLLHTESAAVDTIRLLFEAKGNINIESSRHQRHSNLGKKSVGLYLYVFHLGPDHMGIYFSPAAGVRLKSWSFADGKILDGPVWKDERPTYYIFHSHGISPTPWQFWVEFQVCNCVFTSAYLKR